MLDPLEYQYRTLAKLDYFILSANLALLGWTVVNTDWLPPNATFKILMVTVWSLLSVSIVAGIVKQLYGAMAHGANHISNYTADLATALERALLNGGSFINQQTGTEVTPDHISGQATTQRSYEVIAKKQYVTFSSRTAWAGNIAAASLAAALFVLTALKALTL